MLKKWMSLFFLPFVLVCFSFPGYSSESKSFEWGAPKSKWSSLRRLKERWAFSLLQECLRSKVEKEFVDQGVQYELQSEDGILPCYFAGSFFGGGKTKIAILEKIKEKKDIEISEEFSFLKDLWKKWLEKQKKSERFPDWVKDFSFPSYFSYSDFIDRSEEILADLQLEDLMTAFYVQDSLQIDARLETSPPHIFKEELAARDSLIPSIKKGWEPSGAGARGGEPKSEEARRFFELPVSDEEKILIRKIITNMADKNVVQLLLEKKSMERKGDRIHPVHPMRFAGIVLTDPHLKRCMKMITKSTFKWNGFLDGYEKRMKEEARSGTLICYASGLADLLEVDRSVIIGYLNQGNYGGLIKHFL